MNTYFWAKSDRENRMGISVLDHMKNVGEVAKVLVNQDLKIAQEFGFSSAEVSFLAAIHDIGKITPGFQRKLEDWTQFFKTRKINFNSPKYKYLDNAQAKNHSITGQYILAQQLVERGISDDTAFCLAVAVAVHHGRLYELAHPDKKLLSPNFNYDDIFSNHIAWSKQRYEATSKLLDYFDAQIAQVPNLNEHSPALWWLAGLVSVADWIGSNEAYFPSSKDQSTINSASIAKHAVSSLGLCSPSINKNLSFHDLFHNEKNSDVMWLPNDMQLKLFDAVRKPGVYVVEAPMGLGKTEAALWAGYRLISQNLAKGIYFALPTQTTSNRIYDRFKRFLDRVSPDNIESQLIHSSSWLINDTLEMPESNEHDDHGEFQAKTWFSSSKRALLAPFGVGTIDQALLAIMPSKHFFVRRYALAGKVIILDEVHSYDFYTGKLIYYLIQALEALGCTIIILSATLTQHNRDKLLSVNASKTVHNDAYPMISGRYDTTQMSSISPSIDIKEKNVRVTFEHEEDVLGRVIALANQGARVLWIMNTVDSAQKLYLKLEALQTGESLGLLHSRFPFWVREKLENRWLITFGKERESDEGAILISTQICEQSVDLDADLLVTELAPIDMLLQRMGRLWRHERSNRICDFPEVVILKEKKSLDALLSLDANQIKYALGTKAKVYAPYVLLRTLYRIHETKVLKIPTDIRMLLESVYQPMENEPEAWAELNDDYSGDAFAKERMAQLNTRLWERVTSENEGVVTRYSEIETITIILVKSFDEGRVTFLDGGNFFCKPNLFQLDLKKALYRNQVKVPRYYFKNEFQEDASEPYFGRYMLDSFVLGCVDEDGCVRVSGLLEGKRCVFSEEIGLRVI